MANKSKVGSNVFYNMAYQIIALLTPLITAPYLSRVIGAEGIGIYTYTNSIAAYFFLFAMLGVNNYGNRLVAQTRDEKQKLSTAFWQVYYMQLLLTIICLILYFILCTFVANENNRLIFYMQGLYVFSAAVDINWFAFGLEKFKLTAIRSTFIKIITVISIFLFVKSSEDVWVYTLIILVGNIIGLIIIWPIVFKMTIIQKPSIRKMLQHLKPNLILFIPYIASTAYQGMDKTMLGIFKSESDVGYYNYATNIMNIPLTAIDAIGTVLMPRISNLYINKGGKDTKPIIIQTIFYICIIAIGMGCGVFAIAPTFVPLYLGKEYIYTAKYLMILAFGIPFASIGSIIRMIYLIPYEKDKQYTIAIIIGAAVNFVGNLFLINLFGAYGACITTVGAYIIVLSVQIYYMQNDFNLRTKIYKIVPYILCGIFMILILFQVPNLIHNPIIALVIQLGLGVFIYAGGTLFILVVIQRDNFIKRIFRKK